MNYPSIFNSYPGLYLTQSIFHSLVAGAVAEMAIRSWDVRKPALRQRYHLLAIVFPVFSFPLFQLLNPERGSVQFRLEALFDSGRWLYLELPWGIPLGAVFLAALAVVSLVFLLQEFVPIVRNAFRPGRADADIVAPGDNPKVIRALEELPGENADIFVLEESGLLIFSSTGRHSSIYVSSGLIEALSPEQLRAALAHEIAHVVRSRRPLLIAVYLLRVLMFFNPVVLVAFRRAAQEDEKICDEMAAAATGQPQVLADTLRRLYLPPEEAAPGGTEGAAMRYLGQLESYGFRMEIESRIERLESADPPGGQGRWGGLVATLAAAAAISYFVV